MCPLSGFPEMVFLTGFRERGCGEERALPETERTPHPYQPQAGKAVTFSGTISTDAS